MSALRASAPLPSVGGVDNDVAGPRAFAGTPVHSAPPQEGVPIIEEHRSTKTRDSPVVTRDAGPGWRSSIRYDLPASLVVFLVALPLSLGIAVASDAPVLAGLIAAIVGGIVAGAMGGSPLQVSGPAAGLTVIVAGLVGEFGWAVTCAITVCAGVVQVLFGLSRVARAALAISPVVVHAMLAGIGVTIALQQVHVLLGGESHSSALKNVTELPAQLIGAHGAAVTLGLAVVVIMLVWRRVPGPLGKLPAALVSIVSVTVASVAFSVDVPRITFDGSLLDALALPSLPDGKWGAFAVGVLTVALIASVESLLSAVSVDKMGGTRTNYDRELVGQGAANIASGVVGGLPVTGVIVRSSTNVAAGARTKASAILHGVWILVFAVPFAGLATQIPTAALAGLLIVIGIQLVKWAHIETARRTGDLAVYGVTIAGVVFLNLLEGVIIGLALAVALVLWRVVRTHIHAERVDADQWRVVVEGSCTFLSLPRLTKELASVPPGTAASIDLSVDFLDHAAHQAIDDWQRQHEAAGGTVTIRELGGVEMDSATDGPPERAFAQPRSVRPSQSPEALFITCADSSGPGDLLTIRNVGNLVPPNGSDDSVEAAIAFAVERLGVASIVVCGHSSCGAMGSLLVGSTNGATHTPDPLQSWLRHGRATLEAYDDGRHPVARSAADAGFGPVDQLSMVNVAVQMQTLRSHALVRLGYAEDRLDVDGLFYDSSTASVLRVTQHGVAPLHGELIRQ